VFILWCAPQTFAARALATAFQAAPESDALAPLPAGSWHSKAFPQAASAAASRKSARSRGSDRNGGNAPAALLLLLKATAAAMASLRERFAVCWPLLSAVPAAACQSGGFSLSASRTAAQHCSANTWSCKEPLHMGPASHPSALAPPPRATSHAGPPPAAVTLTPFNARTVTRAGATSAVAGERSSTRT